MSASKVPKEFSINARDLHRFLRVKEPFESWIKKRIKEGEYQEGVDYIKTKGEK